MSQSMAIITVPGVSISNSISISIRSGLSFPLLLSIESVSIVSIGTVVPIAIMPQSICIPGVSISIRSGLSFPLLLSIESISIGTVSIVAVPIAIMSQSMAIITVPGVSISNS